MCETVIKQLESGKWRTEYEQTRKWSAQTDL